MLKARLIWIVVTALSLGGCLESETPCTYFRITEKTLYSSAWQVDTVHVYVKDSVANYFLDTVFLSDGSWQFVSDSPYRCAPGGTIVYKRASGSVVNMPYYFSAYSSPYDYSGICIRSATSIDGYAGDYKQCLVATISDNSIKIHKTQYGNEPVRYWEFSLSKN